MKGGLQVGSTEVVARQITQMTVLQELRPLIFFGKRRFKVNELMELLKDLSAWFAVTCEYRRKMLEAAKKE